LRLFHVQVGNCENDLLSSPFSWLPSLYQEELFSCSLSQSPARPQVLLSVLKLTAKNEYSHKHSTINDYRSKLVLRITKYIKKSKKKFTLCIAGLRAWLTWGFSACLASAQPRAQTPGLPQIK
jgi:hypothetical protein